MKCRCTCVRTYLNLELLNSVKTGEVGNLGEGADGVNGGKSPKVLTNRSRQEQISAVIAC